MKPEEALFFVMPADFRNWLEANHANEREVWIGYFKKSSGRSGMPYAEAVDEALCFGWIDGLTKSLDQERYTNRFTPRRPGGNWSLANVKRVGELTAEGRMHPAGLRAFEQRLPHKTGVYSYESRPQEMPDELAAVFSQNEPAWQFFQAQTPSYRRSMTWWVVSAKQEATRKRRLAALIEESAARHKLDDLRLPRLGRTGE